ncbi:uncharacterized protein BJX67DRAFT_378735 [Aspergillus lucknowensis]|uniref:Transcription factor IIIC subunit delta N-term-domain-containing protein n=1 Tax=Aspergillus lucknowensis TaxID=176173 RepID=A0ABR4LYQ2_9EURO
MLEPLELQVFPSCYSCISWSDDGEIAVASGEYVHVLTPKPSSGRERNGVGSGTVWHRTRFRANVFTVTEWPIMLPQPRDQFSVGVEQSMSTVVAVAWSPPGLVKHKRSVLAVLTSNQVLSIYAYVGRSGKWTRIAIVNKALEIYFGEGPHNDYPKTRRSSIRALAWTAPLKIPVRGQLNPGPASRWGIPLLAVTTDANDVAFLKFHTLGIHQPSSGSLPCEIVSTVSLHDSGAYDRFVQPNSLFASALASEARMLSLESGPWLYQSQQGEGQWSAVLNVAGIQGTKLKLVRLSAGIELRTADFENEPNFNLSFHAEEHTAAFIGRMCDFQLTGPIGWTTKVDSGTISIAVGAVAALVSVDLPERAYNGEDSEDTGTHPHLYPLLDSSWYGIEQAGVGHYERISGMTITIDPESDEPVLHFGTVGGYAAIKPLGQSLESKGPSQAPWKSQIEDIRERFDIDRDLGGLAVSRVWGIASNQGLVAVAVTLHPGDMVEYRTAAEDRLTVVFYDTNGQTAPTERIPFLRGSSDAAPEFLAERRDIVLRHILRTGDGVKRTLSPKVLYAAACCAIVQPHSAELLSNARKALESLAEIKGVDLTDEIAKCSVAGSTIDAKQAEALDAIGGDIFEKCGVCGAGIAWDSTEEAQCANGHIFVRCNLTFLAIQEPGISKFCSQCDSEYLDEDLVGLSSGSSIQQSCRSLSDVFDTCIYCNGKFRP